MFTKSWRLPVTLFLFSRLFLVIAFSQEGLRGFGDFTHFYNLADLGVPFFDIWVEFPPLFPFLSRLLFLVAGSRQHVYDYLLALLLTCAQAGTIVVFYHLAERFGSTAEASQRTWIFTVISLGLPYGWWYFDPLTVFWMLLGFYWAISGRSWLGGGVLGLGILTKLFPVLVLPALWKIKPWKQATATTLAAVGITFLVYAGLYLASPDYTRASIFSQSNKSSWESVWALLDGNLKTGNFGPEIERFDPELATRPLGNPARISSWLTLIPFAALGLWLIQRSKDVNEFTAATLIGITWCIFLVWAPGYSPSWVLYLLPLVVLVLPLNTAVLMAFVLVLINILEWPVMLSRGYNWGLWITIPLRTLLWIILLAAFYKAGQESIQGQIVPETS